MACFYVVLFLFVPCQPETPAHERVVGRLRRAVGAAQVLGKVVPAAAAADACGAVFGAGRIGLRLLRIGAVAVPAPFAHVAVNVVQAEGVGLEAAYVDGVRSV